jgi:ribosomal protein L16 Arg81 hydroxylase
MDKNINDFISRIDALRPCSSSDSVAFFSQKQQEAYGGHRDSDDVLVIQLQGKKIWKIYEPQQRRYFGNSPLAEEEMGTLAAEITMSPGDALFLRAGVPHIVHTPFEYSLHLAFDINDRTTNIEQITNEANNRYNHACADSFAPAGEVVDRYIDLIKSDQFQADLKYANEDMAKQIAAFREKVGNTSSVTSLSRFIK